MCANEDILREMIRLYAGDPRRIQHFVKVYQFARLIGLGENLPPRTQRILEVAAMVHDIGIHASEARYGDASGKHQEELGPALAESLLADCGLPPAEIQRVCRLIGCHHTYDPILGVDHQILLEADYLVNAYEDGKPPAAALAAGERFFATQTGLGLLREIYAVPAG